MTFKLAQSAEMTWHRLRSDNQLPKIIMGVKFNDGVEVSDRKLTPLPPDPVRHQDSAIARASISAVANTASDVLPVCKSPSSFWLSWTAASLTS